MDSLHSCPRLSALAQEILVLSLVKLLEEPMQAREMIEELVC